MELSFLAALSSRSVVFQEVNEDYTGWGVHLIFSKDSPTTAKNRIASKPNRPCFNVSELGFADSFGIQ